MDQLVLVLPSDEVDGEEGSTTRINQKIDKDNVLSFSWPTGSYCGQHINGVAEGYGVAIHKGKVYKGKFHNNRLYTRNRYSIESMELNEKKELCYCSIL